MQTSTHELRFVSLFNPGQAMAFPCDEHGHVNLDTLPELARLNYFFVRAMTGRDWQIPVITAPTPAILH